MPRYAVTLELWQQYGFTEQDVGGRTHRFEVCGDTITQAAKVADLVGSMMQRGNPVSWNYSITEMKRLS